MMHYTVKEKSEMKVEVVPLEHEHLAAVMLQSTYPSRLSAALERAYLSPGSAAYCVLVDGIPVLAGGIVNMDWHRGEAWIIPTEWFRSHLKTSLRILREYVPKLADNFCFRRVQATCVKSASAKLFKHLGFHYEGTLRGFGPSGETCDIYSRIFE